MVKKAVCPLLTRLIFSFISILSWAPLTAQKGNYSFTQLSVEDGLSQSTVYCMLEDSKGFIWMGTRTGGLNKFDGYDFKHYYYDPYEKGSIGSNEILDLFEDSHGVIWICTRNGGLNSYNYDTGQFHKYLYDPNDEKSIPNSTSKSVYEAPDGVLWVGTNSGLCTFDRSDGSFTNVYNNLRENDTFGSVSSISEDGMGNICIGTAKGAFMINIESRETFKQFLHDQNDERSLTNNNIKLVYYDKSGQLWIGTRNHGLNRLDNSNTGEFTRIKSNVDDPKSIASNIIRTIHEDKNGNMWIGTKQGLELMYENQKNASQPTFVHFVKDENDDMSLSQNSVYSFIEDSHGNFWVGTWSRGVNYMQNGTRNFEHFKHLVNNESTVSNNLISCFEDGEAGVWVGTEEGGLNLFDPSSRSFTKFRHDEGNEKTLISDHIKTLLLDSENDLWVGTYRGLNFFNKEDNNFDLYLKGLSIYSIMDYDGVEIWIGTNKGLYILSKNDKVIRKYDSEKLTNVAIHVVFKDGKNNIWIGTKDGLNQYDPDLDKTTKFFHSYTDTSSISHRYITSINEDRSGNLWVATLGGLNKLDQNRKSFTRYGRNANLPDVSISNLIFDMNGDMWITTNKGLSRIYSESLSEKKFTVQNYDVGDGLQGQEFIMNASYISETGDIFLGGINGFNVFNPSRMSTNSIVPNIVLTSFKLFNKEVVVGGENSPLSQSISETKSIILDPDQSSISFDFVALNFQSPEKNQYAYMLEGFDKTWISAGASREASYTNLSSGVYTFKVKGSNNDNVWNEDGVSVEIEVLPYWWETNLFRISVFVFLVLVATLFYKNRRRKIQSDRAILEQKVNDATTRVQSQNEILTQEQQKLKEAVKETNQVIEQAVQSGNFDGRILLDNKEGEWKSLAESINAMFESVSKPFREINLVIDHLAKGSLTSRYVGDAKGEIKNLTDNLNMAIQNLEKLLVEIALQTNMIGESSDEMLLSAEEMNTNTTEISSSISEMSRGAMDQQLQIDQSSNLLEEILSTMNEMSDDAEVINNTANVGSDTSENGMKLVQSLDFSMQQILDFSGKTGESIHELIKKSNEITSVVSIIKDIASQTNLLALNAAIEAAQAGDSGRGFAVVAEEIRKLAEDSKRSVSKIEDLIGSVQLHTSETAKLIEDMDGEIQSGEDASKQTLATFQEIANQYKETYKKSEQIVLKVKKQTSDVHNVVNLSRGIVVISEETAAGTEQVASSATELAAGMINYTSKTRKVSEIVNELVKKVSQFKFSN